MVIIIASISSVISIGYYNAQCQHRERNRRNFQRNGTMPFEIQLL